MNFTVTKTVNIDLENLVDNVYDLISDYLCDKVGSELVTDDLVQDVLTAVGNNILGKEER